MKYINILYRLGGQEIARNKNKKTAWQSSAQMCGNMFGIVFFFFDSNTANSDFREKERAR